MAVEGIQVFLVRESFPASATEGETIRVTNQVYKPGRFVTFQAYEWSGLTSVGGDHNVFFLHPDPPIYRSRSYYDYRNLQMYHGPEPQVNHVEDLFATRAPKLKNNDILAIPHYGGRKGNPDWHNPKIQRMIEVFSEHPRPHAHRPSQPRGSHLQPNLDQLTAPNPHHDTPVPGRSSVGSAIADQ